MSDFKIVKLLNPPVVISVAINPRGVYDNSTAYAQFDSVSYLGSSYVCITATTGHLPTDTTYWQLLSAQGATGPTGPAGPNLVDTTTSTTINTLLKGDGAHVQPAVAGTDYATPGGVTSAVAAETTRATTAEGVIATNLANEITRATAAEGTNATNIANEITRATTAEGVIATNLANEITRATTAEGTNATNIANEITRATGAEGTLTTNLASEVTRATNAEAALSTTISNLDISKPRPDPFILWNQTAGPTGSLKYQSVTVSGRYAYVAGGGSGSTLSIFDILDQSNPVLKGNIILAGTYGVAVQGNYCYVPSSGGSSLYIVNISNPSSPTVTGSVLVSGSPGSLYSCVVSGNYCYISTQSKGLTVVDVTNPAAPVQVYQEGGTLNKSFGIAISGTTLYTTNFQAAAPWTVRYLKTWDVTTPTSPSLLNTYTLPANTKPGNLILDGNIAFISDINVSRVHLIDITTPTSPVFISTYIPTGSFNADFTAHVAKVSDSFMYVPSGSLTPQGGAIDFVDISTPANPVKITTVYTNQSGSVFGGIDIANGYIYAGDYGVAPGSSSTLDVFTMPVENEISGYITAQKYNNLPAVSTSKDGIVSATEYAQLAYEIARDLSVNAYAKELIYSTGVLTRINVWTSPAKTVKMYQKDFNYTLGVLSSIVVTRISDSATFTKTLTYATGVLTEVDGA